MKLSHLGVQEYLPHRYPFLLVDRVLECDSKTFITVQKNVTINEPHFQGHFPDYPVFPGVLVLEAMAQATGILSAQVIDESIKANAVFVLAGIDKARMKKQVMPGDVLIIRADVLHQKRNVMKFDVTAKVDDRIVASAEIMGAYGARQAP